MGGPGSGRYWFAGARRSTADECRLDVRALHRQGFLRPLVSGVVTWTDTGYRSRVGFHVEGDERAEAFWLTYSVNGEPVVLRVDLAWTACHFGGVRPWALCPSCGRRIAVLYGGRRFACWRCRGLAYASTREDRASRLIARAQRIRVRLGGSDNLWAPFPEKPPRMHWRTYWRLREEAEEAYAGAMMCVAERLQSEPAGEGISR